MSISEAEMTERSEHPLDIMERLAAVHEWPFDRADENEISITVAGSWANYNIALTWLDEMEALHIACAFDLRVTPRQRASILELIAMINEQLWIGHFDLWSREDVAMFRHALLLAGGAEPNGRQCETILKLAVESCDRYFQAFQFVLWSDKAPAEALAAVMFETLGEA